MKNKLLIGLILGLIVTLTPSCSSFSVQTDKATVVLPDKKIEIEGVKIEGKSKDSEPK